MGFNYKDLPRCRGCTMPEDLRWDKNGFDRYDCALYWRPGTGTKTGFPMEDGFQCPRDPWERMTKEERDALIAEVSSEHMSGEVT